MALKKCKECGCDVSTKAEVCPSCGVVLKKKKGCLGYIGSGILFIFIIGIIGSIIEQDSEKSKSSLDHKKLGVQSKTESVSKVYNEKDTVSIGYTSYAVWRSWWSNHLSNNIFLNENPDANFLFVELTIKNNDKKPRSVAPFKLIDEQGAEYESSSKSWQVEGSIGVLSSLNPNVKKTGFIVFDVPKDNIYKLKVSGGYWSSDVGFIKLSPKDKKSQ